ncbi:MAG: Dabb family protein [Opitutaceae bacterium]|nr:Dabb family protein [Opitutaceae bacterium]
MKKLVITLLTAALLSLGLATVSAQTEPKKKKKAQGEQSMSASQTAPKSIIHVVTVAWKPGTTPEQIQAALDAVKAMPAQYKGLNRVWTKTVKIQNQKGAETKVTHAIAMEFANEEVFKAYTDSPAQLEWYKIYQPIRQTSTTHDISN